MNIAADTFDPQALRIDNFEQRVARSDDLTGPHICERNNAADWGLELNLLYAFRCQYALLLTERIAFGFGVIDFTLRDDAGNARQARKLLFSRSSACHQPRPATAALFRDRPTGWLATATRGLHLLELFAQQTKCRAR